MFVPIVPTEAITDENGERTKPWDNFFQQQAQNMQESLSDEGFAIPSVSSASNSVSPPATGGQLAQLQASFGTQQGVQVGRLVFDPNTNQLKVILNDGTFHPITTT